MRNLFFTFLLAFVIMACEAGETLPQDSPVSPEALGHKISTQLWLAELDLGARKLPFRFRIDEGPDKPKMVLLNAEEEIPVPDLREIGDSTIFRMPFFDSEIRAERKNGQLEGTWYNNARSDHNRIPFSAVPCPEKCLRQPSGAKAVAVAGNWEVTFVYQGSDTSKALGKFQQNGDLLSGTFLTPTGDYRYLEGHVKGNALTLSCFDGAHAFLFEATLDENGHLSGGFWSGAHWYESWTALPTEHFDIPNPDSLTYLREGYETLDFAFPDIDSNIVSLSDDRFKGKVVLVEIMGSWCPNCKDETALLHEMYGEMRAEGLEIVSLSFERKDDFAYGSQNIRRMIQAFGLEYPVLFAGKAGRKTAGAALPMLNHIMSYPTTLFVDRQGKVRRIYTGFAGPATGETYTRLVTDFRSYTKKLLAEKPA